MWTRSALEHAKAIRNREITSLELVNYYIKRIEKYDGKINSVVVRVFESARRKASEADRAIAEGRDVGPLHGVPITVKESFWVKHTRSTCAISDLPFFKDFVATSTAPAVKRLLDAGAIVLGKTNVPSHAADIQSYNKSYGTTSNPWNLRRTPGGSSGGSAAAISAGFSALEIGSDIGGSIRIPASFTGVCGHKPSQGIVPLEGHSPGFNDPSLETSVSHQSRIDPLAHKLAVAGPIARSCEDLKLAMTQLAGPTTHMSKNGWAFTLPKPRVSAKEPHRLRVAAWLDDEFCPVEPECVDLMKRNVVDRLRDAGASVDLDARPKGFTFQRSHKAYETILEADMGLVSGIKYTTWFHAQLRRNFIKNRWRDFFQEFDILICPVAPTTAFEHDHSPRSERTLTIDGTSRDYWQALTRWAGLVILADLPSTVVPIGHDSKGMPCGIQIVGAHYQDLQTIEVGALLEGLGSGYVPPKGYDEDETGLGSLSLSSKL